MAGVLSFALGLETSAFSSALDRVGGRLLGFIAVGELVSKTFEKIGGAIASGGQFQDLSARTGESVKSLYQMSEAFKVVGVDAGALPGMVNRFNKSLSGIGEGGEKTTEAFAALGLSMADLKNMDAPAQFQAVAEKLASFDKGSAMDIATRLFGREGAGNIMQITRDVKGFSETLAETGSEGDLMARVAPKFDTLGDTATRIGGKINNAWLAVAEGLEPLIKQVLDFTKSLDFKGVGEKVGHVFSTIGAAFQKGQLGDLMSASFGAAVEFLGNSLFNTIGNGSFWDGVWDVMQGEFMIKWGVIAKSFMSLGSLLAASLDTAIQLAIESLSSLPGVGKLMGTEGFKAKSFGENWASRKDELAGSQGVVDGWIQSGVVSAKAGAEKITGAISDAMSKAKDGPEAQRLATILAGLASPPNLTPSPLASKDSNGSTTATGDSKKPNVTALEKMGFIFDNGGSSVDPSKQTANNTKTLVDLTRKLLAKNTQGTAVVNI